MTGQATVTIGSKQWAVEVATTPTEITTGLSNRSSVPANTGMLFDLGSVYTSLVINMQQMLFPLDIVFISSAGAVVGVAKNIQPQQNVQFTNDSLPGARWFLEVNGGEAADVNVADSVTITGYTPSTGIDWNSILNLVIMVMMMGMMFKVIGGVSIGKAVVSAGKEFGKAAKGVGGAVKETFWD
jgi:uncharacterized membrane protein (UPF0127 family)